MTVPSDIRGGLIKNLEVITDELMLPLEGIIQES
jgi:hypothetical protein